MAGGPGFEPGNGGIKIRCLTTWLRPNQARGPYRRPPQRSTLRVLELCRLAKDFGKARVDDRRRVLFFNRLARLGAHALAQGGIGQLAQRFDPLLCRFGEEAIDAVTYDVPV